MKWIRTWRAKRLLKRVLGGSLYRSFMITKKIDMIISDYTFTIQLKKRYLINDAVKLYVSNSRVDGINLCLQCVGDMHPFDVVAVFYLNLKNRPAQFLSVGSLQSSSRNERANWIYFLESLKDKPKVNLLNFLDA